VSCPLGVAIVGAVMIVQAVAEGARYLPVT